MAQEQNKITPEVYPNSTAALDHDFQTASDTPVTALARELTEQAKAFDLAKLNNLGVNGRISGVSRDYKSPPDYTHENVVGASWADNEDNPLEKDERWNEGRRATLSGLSYTFNERGLPINPYMETGMNGRGVLGRFGPNNAVDNGALIVKDGELYAIGILRKFDNNAPAFSGGFAKYNFNEAGDYVFDKDAVIETQLEEFFEEMISGSIDLLPEYQDQVNPLVAAEVGASESKLGGKKLSQERVHEIHEQVETGLKLQQVRDKDPEFLARLKDLITTGRECFSGPVLNDNRTTNNAWIESHLSWFVMDDVAWQKVRGDKPVFNYQLSAGDDASGVVLHHLDSKLIQTAYASHGSMFCFMFASYLLNKQKNSEKIETSIVDQAQEIVQALGLK